ncbi:MAG: hypothetical protein EA376_14150 [Phycisphaeraceae bacterium]|nr:MAG: hypothetical protein EA376_14150 [Phycisphaeraceae bacterium]
MVWARCDLRCDFGAGLEVVSAAGAASRRARGVAPSRPSLGRVASGPERWPVPGEVSSVPVAAAWAASWSSAVSLTVMAGRAARAFEVSASATCA